MKRRPLGVSRLDWHIGGAPAGSVVLLAGESGACAREFVTVLTTETFRVADCPFVLEDEALEGRSEDR